MIQCLSCYRIWPSKQSIARQAYCRRVPATAMEKSASAPVRRLSTCPERRSWKQSSKCRSRSCGGRHGRVLPSLEKTLSTADVCDGSRVRLVKAELNVATHRAGARFRGSYRAEPHGVEGDLRRLREHLDIENCAQSHSFLKENCEDVQLAECAIVVKLWAGLRTTLELEEQEQTDQGDTSSIDA